MIIYCICTQYSVGAHFALITASIWCGMEVISLWHCWGGMEAQVSLSVAFSSSEFFGLLFLIFLLTIWASPPFLQTLWPWFPNEIQNFLLSEKRTLDHWATVQFSFSLAQVRRLLPNFFLTLNFLLTCLDTALCEQPASLVINVCGLPSLWRLSMIVFWTTVRLAVFSKIV